MMCPVSAMGSCGGSKVSMLLVALALGYGVLVLANREQRPLDVLGKWIGAIIILVSFGGLLCTAVSRVCGRWGHCGKPAMSCGMGGVPPMEAAPGEPIPQK